MHGLDINITVVVKLIKCVPSAGVSNVDAKWESINKNKALSQVNSKIID